MTLLAQDHLRTLASIRERCQQVYEQVKRGGDGVCFDIDESKLPDVMDAVAATTERRFANLNEIPPHSRIRHFDPKQLEKLDKEGWAKVDAIEKARRLVDLVVVSVLVDAGAGQTWKYKTSDDKLIGRSEGLALASFDMFMNGYFSGVEGSPDRVDVKGLKTISVERMEKGFQVTGENQMVGLEGRSELLKRLGGVLENEQTYFPSQQGLTSRPGNIVDYLLKQKAESSKEIRIETLWEAVMSLGKIWPPRVTIDDVPLGDVWPCAALTDLGNHENLVPFHKLSQWLTYSLIEAIESKLDIQFKGIELMTGLPEYRNGGLLVDYNLLTLKPEVMSNAVKNDEGLPVFEGSDPAVVEWRALTVIYLDKIHKGLEKKWNRQLALAQVLEGGTWTVGREIAAKLRPKNGGPPIVIKSDGTIF